MPITMPISSSITCIWCWTVALVKVAAGWLNSVYIKTVFFAYMSLFYWIAVHDSGTGTKTNLRRSTAPGHVSSSSWLVGWHILRCARPMRSLEPPTENGKSWLVGFVLLTKWAPLAWLQNPHLHVYLETVYFRPSTILTVCFDCSPVFFG